jgi:hypothetical protein
LHSSTTGISTSVITGCLAGTEAAAGVSSRLRGVKDLLSCIDLEFHLFAGKDFSQSMKAFVMTMPANGGVRIEQSEVQLRMAGQDQVKGYWCRRRPGDVPENDPKPSRMAGKRRRQSNEDVSSQSRMSELVQAKNLNDIGKIDLEDGFVILYRKENQRNGYRLKVSPPVWTEMWRRKLQNVPQAVINFVCKGRQCHDLHEDNDIREADFSLIKDPEFEYSPGGMQFEVSSVADLGAVLLSTDQCQIEFVFSVRGNDISRISDNFIAMSHEKDHVQYIGHFAPKFIMNIVEPKFGGSFKYTPQLKRPKSTTKVACASPVAVFGTFVLLLCDCVIV